MVALRNRAEERKGRTPLHLSLMYQQRLGRKWNGYTNYACQTTFTTSGTSVSSGLLKAQGVCYKSFNSFIHTLINSLIEMSSGLEGKFHVNMI